jgi:hypothetical protein
MFSNRHRVLKLILSVLMLSLPVFGAGRAHGCSKPEGGHAPFGAALVILEEEQAKCEFNKSLELILPAADVAEWLGSDAASRLCDFPRPVRVMQLACGTPRSRAPPVAPTC